MGRGARKNMLHYGEKVGELKIKDCSGSQFTIDIRKANCLAAFVYVEKCEEDSYRHHLYGFFLDEKAVTKMAKAGGGKPISDEVLKIRLNMRHKENYKLLRILVKYYTVECYSE